MTDTCSRTVSGMVFEMLNCQNVISHICTQVSQGMYLKDDMFLEDVLNAIDLVLHFRFSKLRWCSTAIEHRSIRRKLWNLCELLGISGLFFGG